MKKFYVYGIIAFVSPVGIAGFAEGGAYISSIICLLVFGFSAYMAAVEAERHEYRMRREHEKAMRRKKEDSYHRPKRTESSTQEIA